MTTASEMQAKVAKWMADVDRQELFINGTAQQEVVLGDGRRLKTMAKLEAEATVQIDKATQAAANAIGAQNAVALDRQRAETAKDLAAAAALTAPNVYATEAAGRGSVADNQTFWVDGADAGLGLYRRQNAGASTLLTRMLSTSALGGVRGASLMMFAMQDPGAYPRDVETTLSETVSVLMFRNDDGSVIGTGSDDSTGFLKSFKNGRIVRIPAGVTVRCNIMAPAHMRILGETTRISSIEPFDKSKPAITIPNDGFYWGYGRTIENIFFNNAAPKFLTPQDAADNKVNPAYQTGLGLALGTYGPEDKNQGSGAYPQYSSNLVCRNVTFRHLRKGFIAGCGNIGVEFYSCNVASCYYGYYLSDNKGGGDAMHAGCKYFYGGETDDCEVAVYIDNVTEGFGAVAFYGTIMEYNSIAVYMNSNNVYFPISFYDVWNEGNGQAASDPAHPGQIAKRAGQTVKVDKWDGSNLSQIDVPARTWVIDGTRCALNFYGGFFTDVLLRAKNSRITSRDSHVESSLGYGGARFDVVQPSSHIDIHDPKTLGGIGVFPNVIVHGIAHIESIGSADAPTDGHNPTFAGSRALNVKPRWNKLNGGGVAASGFTQGISIGYDKPRPLTGYTNYTTQASAGGRTFPFIGLVDMTTTSGGEFLLDNHAVVETQDAGYWVITYDIRRIDGQEVEVLIGDLSTTQIVSGVRTTGTEFFTVAAMAYLPAGRSFFPAFRPVNPGRTVFLFGAYQARRFSTLVEAQAFLADGVYFVEGDDQYMLNGSGFSFKIGNIVPYRFGPNAYNGTLEFNAADLSAKRIDFNDGVSLNLNGGGGYKVNNVKVLGARQPAIPDAGSTDAKVAALLAMARNHGLIES